MTKQYILDRPFTGTVGVDWLRREVGFDEDALIAWLEAYRAYCEESAWVDASERLPERYEGYPLTKNCLLFDGEKYLFGFYSYAHSQWESDEFAPLERITHWRPLPAPPQKIPANH